MSEAMWATMAFIGLGAVLTGLAFHDTIRYRRGNRASFCRVHKRGGMWFFRIGCLGGSLYMTRGK
jgi:hypothetical protein